MSYPRFTKAISAYAAAGSLLTPLAAVVRLFETASVHLHLARDAAREGKYQEHFNQINRAMMIFAGLDGVLNDKITEDVTISLRRFYRTVIVQCGLAASRRDPAAATQAIIDQVSTMVTAWRTIAAERGVTSYTNGASAKEPHASALGRPTEHAQLRILG